MRSERGGCEWTVREAWALLALMLAALLVKDLVLASEVVRQLSADDRVFARVGTLFGFYAVVAGALGVLVRRRGVSIRAAFRLQALPVAPRALLVSVALVAALLVAVRVAGLGYSALMHVLGQEPPTRVVADLPDIFGPTVAGFLLSIVLVVAVAPLIEEIVFRGVLQEALALEFDWRVAVSISAALFALYHTTPWLFAPLFVVGVACGWLAHTRATLLPAIALHAAYNALPVALAFYPIS